MLNKIRNIEPGADYNRSGKYKGYENSSRIIDSSLISISDSKEFSPALAFLARIKWRLTNIKFIDKDRITLTLNIKNYEISTVLDLVNLSATEEITYNIVSKLEVDGSEKKYLAKINSLVFYNNGLDESFQVNLEPMDTLFERFASLRINSELRQSDTTLIKNLVEDIKKELGELFGYINKIFLIFTRKLLQLQNVGVLESKNDVGELITLISITSTSI